MKSFRLISILLFAVVLFSSCGTDTVDKQEEVMTIDWLAQNDQPHDFDSPVMAELQKQFGVKFNFIYLDRSKSAELLNIRVSSGEIPDVMNLTSIMFNNFIDQEIISEIPEKLLKEVAPTLYENTIKYSENENIWNIAKRADKLYGIPGLSSSGNQHAVPIWRDDWLEKVGINKIPETLEEAENAFYKFTSDDPDGNGRNDTYGLSTNGIRAIFNAYGAHPYDMFWAIQDGKAVLAATLPEMKDALAKLNKWYKDGIIDPEFITGENKGQGWSSSVTFWNGKIGFSMPGMYYHVNPPFEEGETGSVNWINFKQVQGDNGSYVWGKPLIGPDGKFGAEHWALVGSGYFAMGNKVAPGSDKMKKILEIQETIGSDPDTFKLAVFGREGEEYYVSESGKFISTIDRDRQAALGLNANGLVLLHNNFEFSQIGQSKASEEWISEYAEVADEYRNAIPLGLPSDTQYKSVIDSKIQESYMAFILGNKDIGEFDNFVEELNNAGLEQLTQEANAWLAESKK